MRGTKDEKAKLLPRLHPLAVSSEKRAAPLTSPNQRDVIALTTVCNTRPQNALVTLLTLSAGIGGFLFGYDTGVISGALPFMRDDLLHKFKPTRHILNFLEELIVSSAILAAGCGAAMGGWLSDKIGRRTTLLVGDAVFCLGAILMASAQNVTLLITGRVVVGLGVGLASVTVPVYIAECSPVTLRASLVTGNVLMITTGKAHVLSGSNSGLVLCCSGQLVSYIVNYFFTYVPGTWRWMLGVAGVPALLQFVALCLLPESPRWLFLSGHRQKAQKVLRQLMPQDEIDEAKEEMQTESQSGLYSDRNLLKAACKYPELRLQLCTGIGLQVMQQLCGINTVMYYTPTILEIAGFVDKRQALFLSILPAFVNSVGTAIGMWCIDRYGRRKLLLSSLGAVFGSLLLASWAFHLGESTSGKVLHNPIDLPAQSLCSASNCHECLNTGITEKSCSFCTSPLSGSGFDGICVVAGETAARCPEGNYTVYDSGCPNPYQSWLISFLIIYLLCFAPGVGPVPWAINAEIYPAEIRGMAGGAAATANWLTNFVVSQCFLTISEAVGISGTFLIYTVFALCGFIAVWIYLPETKGLTFDEIQSMYKSRVARW